MIPIYKNSELKGDARKKVFRRSQADVDELYNDVKFWIDKVRKDGDAAIVEYIQKFDDPNFEAQNIRVTQEEIKKAYAKIDDETLRILKRQIEISRNFHEAQAERIFAESKWEIEYVSGVRTGAKKTPLDSAGCYVPAGKAPLPTISQILTVAAKAAKVPRIAVFFPPTGNYPEILVAADLAGADEIYRVGGIAAIAAMAYGTETIQHVEKISGPGSPWVQAAKLQVFGQVGIDMLAGPSEALYLADETSNPKFLAADILARCEHGADSAAVMVTTSWELADQVRAEIEEQRKSLSREEYFSPALENGYSSIILVDSLEEMIDFANEYGCEHASVQTKNAEADAEKIRNAGSIFIGNYAPVAIGDYASGTNHSLPTSRAVKFSSPVGVETFIKTVEYQVLTKEGLQDLSEIIETVADIEGLDGHKNSVLIRCKY
jgi:histidinol dehydrogenase